MMRLRRGQWGCTLGLLVGTAFGCSGQAPVGPPTRATARDDAGARQPVPPPVTLATAPPPISGGTLLALHDSVTAVASDPDRDRIYVVDLAQRVVRHTVTLTAGDEPGRLAEDASGRVHVALRRAGQIVALDPSRGEIVARRAVCAAPRGVAYDAPNDALHVACAGGELITLPAGGGAPTRVLQLERDLRDVAVDHGRLIVTTFRSARVMALDAQGAVVDRSTLRSVAVNGVEVTAFTPAVAWRAAPLPGGGAVVVHQVAREVPLLPTGYYEADPGIPTGTGMPGAVLPAVSETHPFQTPAAAQLLPTNMVLPVDVAVTGDGLSVALVAAGQAAPDGPANLLVLPRPLGSSGRRVYSGHLPGRAIAVAFTARNEVLVQTREPAALHVVGEGGRVDAIGLSAESREDTGHSLFHTDSGRGIACASCHAEGGDDGHVWRFDGGAPRRTPSLRGGLRGDGPFHWAGELPNLAALVDTVFVHGMGGTPLDAPHVDALRAWLDRVPTVPATPPRDPDSVARGRALFADPNVACASCHDPAATRRLLYAVRGADGAMLVPSLRGLALRAPYMHDGCAATLADRFDPACGGTSHGHTAQLDAAQRADLIAYLESL